MAKRIFLLDSSGSMESVLEDTIGGFNSFVRSQVPLGGTLSFYTFSDRCKCEYRNVPIEDVKPLTHETYIPGGSTALYDAMGKVLTDNGEPLDNDADLERDNGEPLATTLVVLTDGQENASRKYTKSHVKDLIRFAGDRLSVIYIGVDIEEAADLGIQNTLEYEPARTPDLFRLVSESVSSNVVKHTRQRPSKTVDSTEAIDSSSPRSTCHSVPNSLPF